MSALRMQKQKIVLHISEEVIFHLKKTKAVEDRLLYLPQKISMAFAI